MKKVLNAFALLTLAGVANAQPVPKLSGTTDTGLSYNEVGMGYGSTTVTISNKDYTFSGLGFADKFLVHENFYIVGTHVAPSTSINGVSVDITQTTFGGGARVKVASNTDAFVQYEYIDSKVAALSASEKTTGNGLTVGLKTLLGPKVEGGIYTGYVKLKDAESATSVGVGLGFRAADNFIVRASYSSAKDSNSYTVSLNYAF